MSQSYIGAHGGFVLVVCDDPGIHSSQNEQDTRLFARFANVPILEPSDAQEALDFTKLAFEISETFDTPVIVRSTTRLSHTRSLVRIGTRSEPAPKGFVDAPNKTVTIPANARRLHPKIFERETKVGRYFEELAADALGEGRDAVRHRHRFDGLPLCQGSRTEGFDPETRRILSAA